MRFLCLHGAGVNAKIMESAMSAIRYEFGEGHTFEYVDAAIPTELNPELRGMLPEGDKYYQYGETSKDILQAIEDLDAYLKFEGPFDGIVAHCEPSQMVATYLAAKTYYNPNEPLPIKFAIFFSGSQALDPIALKNGELKPLNLDGKVAEGLRLALPTAHIWGTNDWAKEKSQGLYALSDPEARLSFQHDGGHGFPITDSGVLGTVRVMRRIMDQAVSA